MNRNIIEPDDAFDFKAIKLTHPINVPGGAYFTRIEYNKQALYIQTPQSQTKQGILKSGKKYHCDLMFDKTAEQIINWFETLEETCRKLIYERKADWFQGNLEESDIESAFNSIVRTYKSGKYYLVRTNIRTGKDESPLIKIYNDCGEVVSLETVNTEVNVVSILEIQGIKFTTRNFAVEIELKQMMTVDNNKMFETFLFKTPMSAGTKPVLEGEGDIGQRTSLNPSKPEVETNANVNDKLEYDAVSGSVKEDTEEEPQSQPSQSAQLTEDNNIQFTFEEIEPLAMDEPQELIEADDIITNNLDAKDTPLELKKPNQVYYNLYREARKKAKQAKKQAILAFLEAKNIKNTYMIETLDDDSDADMDDEIDAVSESELDDYN